jgi:hypothetical protein
MKLLLICILRVLLSHFVIFFRFYFLSICIWFYSCLIMQFRCFCFYEYVFSLYVYDWLPWLRFFRASSSVVRKMPEQNPQRRGTTRTLPNFSVVLCIFVLFYVFLCCSIYCLFCDVLCIVCVYMCTVLLSPVGYPIAVKYIISYQYETANLELGREMVSASFAFTVDQDLCKLIATLP